MSAFESFKRPATKDEIANHLTHEAIDEMEALRKGRDGEPHSPQEQDIMHRLAALMTGPRKHVAIPIVRQRWPQMAALLDRSVGLLESLPADQNAIYGIIRGVNGNAYQFTAADAQEAGLTLQHVADAVKVTFLPSDDGMARNIQVIG